MEKSSFRAIVREELASLLEGNKKVMSQLARGLATGLEGAARAQVEKGLLKRIGKVENDERDTVLELVEDLQDFMTRSLPKQGTTFDEYDYLCQRIEEVSKMLRSAPGYNKPSPAERSES